MENSIFCKNKKMALSILEALALHNADTRARAAIEAVRGYIDRTCFDVPENSEERQRLIAELEREMAKTATDEERKRMIRLYCDLQPDTEFNVVVLPPGADCMLRTNEEGGDYAGNNDL